MFRTFFRACIMSDCVKSILMGDIRSAGRDLHIRMIDQMIALHG